MDRRNFIVKNRIHSIFNSLIFSTKKQYFGKITKWLERANFSTKKTLCKKIAERFMYYSAKLISDLVEVVVGHLDNLQEHRRVEQELFRCSTIQLRKSK